MSTSATLLAARHHKRMWPGHAGHVIRWQPCKRHMLAMAARHIHAGPRPEDLMLLRASVAMIGRRVKDYRKSWGCRRDGRILKGPWAVTLPNTSREHGSRGL